MPWVTIKQNILRPERAQEPQLMPQSLAKIYVHLVFSTKNRERVLPDEVRADLHAYMGGTLNGLGCSPIEINIEPDHAHLLFVMSRTETLSDVVGQVKKSANDWLRARGPQFANFYWQGGYGAFSVSQSAVEEVRAYIRNQRQHHQQVSFQDEFRAFLKRYEIEFDERYVWD
jgi:putative transposase